MTYLFEVEKKATVTSSPASLRSDTGRLQEIAHSMTEKKITVLCIAIPLALYGMFVLPRLGSPGLYADEVYTIMPALKMLGYFVPAGGGLYYLEFRGLSLPLAFGLYNGTIESYLAAPFIAVMGTTPEALRACTILLGGITLILFFQLTRAVTGSRVFGTFGAILLAVHPTFVGTTREGFNNGSALLLFETAAMLGLLYWRRTGRAVFLHAGCLALGLGLGSRGWFIYCLTPLAVLAFVFRPETTLRDLVRRVGRSWKILFLAFAFFLLGAMPFVLQHIRLLIDGTGGTNLLSGTALASSLEVDILDYWGSLGVRLVQIVNLLRRDVILAEQFPQASLVHYLFYWPVFCFSIIWSLASLLLGQGRGGWAVRIFFLVYFVVFLAVSPFTLGRFYLHHVLLILPIAMLIVTLSVQDAMQFIWPRWRIPLLVLLIVVAFSLDAPKLQTRLKNMSGVSMSYSNALYKTARWLRNNDYRHVVILEWDMSPISYLEAGRLAPECYFRIPKLPPDERAQEMASLRREILNPNNIYLTYIDPPNQPHSMLGMFFAEVRRSGMRVVELARFCDEDGRPVIRAFRVAPARLGDHAYLRFPDQGRRARCSASHRPRQMTLREFGRISDPPTAEWEPRRRPAWI